MLIFIGGNCCICACRVLPDDWWSTSACVVSITSLAIGIDDLNPYPLKECSWMEELVPQPPNITCFVNASHEPFFECFVHAFVFCQDFWQNGITSCYVLSSTLLLPMFAIFRLFVMNSVTIPSLRIAWIRESMWVFIWTRVMHDTGHCRHRDNVAIDGLWHLWVKIFYKCLRKFLWLASLVHCQE